MYAAGKRESATEPRLTELVEVGKKLALALRLASKTNPDTVGHRAAWDHAEDATSRLTRMISATTPAAPIIEAAAVRIRRIGPPPTKGDERRAATRRRG